MRVGLLTAELSHGNGWAHYSVSIAESLVKAGVDVRLVSARNTPDDRLSQTRAVLPTITPPDRFSIARMAITAPIVARQLADCDIIHSLVEPYAPLAHLISGNRPLFITIHGSYAHLPDRRRWPIGQFYRLAYQRATLITVSEYTALVVRDVVPSARVITIPNGVDAARYADLPPRTTQRPTILTTGGVKRRKGTLELLKAVVEVKKHLPDVQCVVVGTLSAEPAYVTAVEHFIHDHDLHQHVHLTDFVSEADLKQWYADADVFVMPAMQDDWKFEGFGLTYLEANASGLPVVGVTGSGAQDAIIPDQTGLLVNVDEIETALPRAILYLLTNPELARKLGQNGYQHARQMTWDHTVSQLIPTYSDQLRGSHAG